MSNLSILDRNIIHALDCEITAKVYLRAKDYVPTLEAERYAYQYQDALRFTAKALGMATRIHGLESVPEGLLKFIMDRMWFERFPQSKAAP